MKTITERVRPALQVLVALVFLVAAFDVSAGQEAPEVIKVEPPNWWSAHSINPVRLLIRGRNLNGARVETSGTGLTIGLTRINQQGTYLLVDIVIDRGAPPGPRALHIVTPQGRAEAPFEVSAPIERQGRFKSLTTDDVIYLIMPDRFSDGDQLNNDPLQSRGLHDRSKNRYYHGGDFQGIINRLEYLKALGVTAIWLNPIYDNANRLNEKEMPEGVPITDYHGYGAVDFYGVEEHFGTLDKLKELVAKAQSAGIKVIQDQVANHSGPYHPWVQDAPTPTWYNGTEARHLANTWQTWTLMDPYATYETQRATLEGWFIDILPDLNQNDDEVSRYIIQNTLWWLGEVGFDGIRQDTLPYVPRRFWRDWMEAIKKEHPGVTVIGELYDGNPAMVSFFQGGKARFDGIDSRIDTLFDFPLHYAIRRVFAEGKPIRDLANTLAHDHLYPDPNVLVTFVGLHDMPRFMNEPGATVAGLKLAHAFLLTTRGTPLLYYGDEIAMRGGGDPDNRRDFPGGFPGDSRDAFTEQGRTADEQQVFENARRFIRLRGELQPLRRGSLLNLHVSEHQYAFARRSAEGDPIVVFNNDDEAVEIEFNVSSLEFPERTVLEDRLGVGECRVIAGSLRFRMPARSVSVLVKR